MGRVLTDVQELDDPSGPVRRAFVAAVVVLGVVLGTVAGLVLIRAVDNGGVPHLAGDARCQVADTGFSFSTDQTANAATITAVAMNRTLPHRAVTIALATAMQESKLANLDYGDRDSLGLFQQRPSQGWGSPEQIRDPRYAAGKFYDTLVAVPGWQSRPLTEVAQAVQRSGFPDAYAQWEDSAHALAGALLGVSPAGLACEFDPDDAASESAPPRGLTPRADAVVAEFTTDLPAARQVAGTGTSVDLAPPSWAHASWLVAHADRLGIDSVSFGRLTWTPSGTWRENPAAPTDRIRTTVR